MHPRVDRLPTPQPDYRKFLSAVRRENRDAIPLVELAIAPEVAAAILDQPPPAADDQRREVARLTVKAMHRLGYDVVKMSAPIPFNGPRLRSDAAPPQTAREWQDPHHGAIQSLDDLNAFHWPTPDEISFAAFDTAAEVLPDGMKLIGFSGGVLEFATDLIGFERFMYAVYDDPELIAAVLDHVGRTIHSVFEAYCQMDTVCALWLGDDLGGKNGLLVSPDLLAEHVFPWYRRYRELAHRHDGPFLLHSCGNLEAVMDRLIDDVRIDAKHSFEDSILPVEGFMDRWGSRVGVLGGIDVDLLARGPEDAIVARTQAVLEHAANTGGYACGSGNSIPNYVPPDHFLAMVETVARFNGRR